MSDPSEPAELVTLDRLDTGVAVVTLRNGKVNALSTAVLNRLEAIAAELTADPPGAVVVTGGSRHFAAGADISEFVPGDTARTTEIGEAFLRALGAVAAIPRPVIAEIAGFALGGGCELALACDLRIASESATLGQPEILLGIIPGGGGTQRLPRLVGPAVAKDLIFTGRQVRAEEALRIGLVDRLVPADDLAAEVMSLAESLAAGPHEALGLAKSVIDRGLDTTLAEGIDLEAAAFVEVFDTPDAAIGVESFRTNGPGAAQFGGCGGS